MQDQPNLIEMKAVDLTLSGQKLFDQFTLTVREQQSLVIVGPSGSGKSTLLKMMAGLLTPQQGSILYRGHHLSTLSKKEKDSLRAEMGFLFQQNALFDSMTVSENLRFALTEVKPGLKREERESQISYWLQAVGLDHVPNLTPGEISGGMQKRLGIARALVLQPKVVFYDDPTAGLDPITSRKIIQLILDLKRKMSGTIVTVTNDMMRAYQLAGTIALCFPGEWVIGGSVDETRSHPDPRVQQFIHGSIDGPLGGL